MTVRHRTISVYLLGYGEEGAAVRDGTCVGVVVELRDGARRAVGEEHGVIELVPGRPIRDGDVGEGAVEAEVGVEAEDGAYAHIMLAIGYTVFWQLIGAYGNMGI